MTGTETESDYTITLSPKYEPIVTDNESRYFIITGSRASGKSYSVPTLIIPSLCVPGEVVLYTRYTMVSAEISVIPEFVEKINLLGLKNEFHITKREIIHKKTGSKIIFSGIRESSGDQTAKLKSITGVTTWILDEADELTDEKKFQTIDDSIRIHGKHNRVFLIFNPPVGEHWIYSRFFEPFNIPDEYNGKVRIAYSKTYKQSVYARFIHTTYEDNIDNLELNTLARIDAMKESNYQKYLHIYRGHRADAIEGALWNRDMIDAYRVTAPPLLKSVAVGVDPAITADPKKSDMTGIVTVGLSFNNEFYVLSDDSIIASPNRWAQAVVAAYNRHEAGRIVAEVNQGGDMVVSTIASVNPALENIVEKVHATRGKFIRAEPIASLYEAGKVHHVGYLTELEKQLVTWTPDDSSPDRMDALVWAITKLRERMGGVGGGSFNIPQITQSTRPRIQFSKSRSPPSFGGFKR